MPFFPKLSAKHSARPSAQDPCPLVLAAIGASELRLQILGELPDFGYQVLSAASRQEASMLIGRHAPAVLLLDPSMADSAGPAMPATSRVQVALCDAMDGKVMLRMLQEQGAATCVNLPLQSDVLAATLFGLLRLQGPVDVRRPSFPMEQTQPWALSRATWILTLPDNTPVRLNQTETTFLATLAATPGETVSRAHVIASLGHDLDYYDSRRLDTMLSRLRGKVAGLSGPPLPVRCIHAVGYAVVAPMILND